MEQPDCQFIIFGAEENSHVICITYISTKVKFKLNLNHFQDVAFNIQKNAKPGKSVKTDFFCRNEKWE